MWVNCIAELLWVHLVNCCFITLKCHAFEQNIFYTPYRKCEHSMYPDALLQGWNGHRACVISTVNNAHTCENLFEYSYSKSHTRVSDGIWICSIYIWNGIILSNFRFISTTVYTKFNSFYWEYIMHFIDTIVNPNDGLILKSIKGQAIKKLSSALPIQMTTPRVSYPIFTSSRERN